MPGPKPEAVALSESQREELEQLVRRHTTPQQIALRARIVLLAEQGYNHRQIGRELAITRDTARAWRRRWQELTVREVPVMERLQDAPRSGKPAKFTIEQLTQLYALACEDPRASERPISHWTESELADELVKRGVVDSISPRHVGRLLAEADIKPHQIRYWLTPVRDERFNEKASEVSNVYLTAPERAKKKSER